MFISKLVAVLGIATAAVGGGILAAVWGLFSPAPILSVGPCSYNTRSTCATYSYEGTPHEVWLVKGTFTPAKTGPMGAFSLNGRLDPLAYAYGSLHDTRDNLPNNAWVSVVDLAAGTEAAFVASPSGFTPDASAFSLIAGPDGKQYPTLAPRAPSSSWDFACAFSLAHIVNPDPTCYTGFVHKTLGNSRSAPYVKVLGNQIVDANGNPFLIKGVIVRPVIATATYEPKDAIDHFGEPELTAAKTWGANTIRILTSQPGLDPEDPQYSSAYIQEVRRVARKILDNGFILNIGVNWEASVDKNQGYDKSHCLPTQATERAWNTLLTQLPFLTSTRYVHQVMLEPYNEPVAPAGGTSVQDWQAWQNGGAVSGGRYCDAMETVGMNALIKEIRAAGAKNIIIADGLGWAHFLDPSYPLTDPRHQLAYAAHPFLESWKDFTLTNNVEHDYAVLDNAFGDMQSHGPIIATAVAGGGVHVPTCADSAPYVIPIVLGYLRTHNIGAIGFTFDLPPNSLTADWNWTPSNYNNFNCTKNDSKSGGMGELLEQWFQLSTALSPAASIVTSSLTSNNGNPTLSGAATGLSTLYLSIKDAHGYYWSVPVPAAGGSWSVPVGPSHFDAALFTNGTLPSGSYTVSVYSSADRSATSELVSGTLTITSFFIPL